MWISGCATQNDAVAQAGKAEKNAPGIEETRAIAEPGFIFGLPLVMNYAVMYPGFVDKHPGQYKTALNQIYNEMLPNLKTNADGSLTIYIQHDSPGADKESNWLPAPSGPLYPATRLYWPKTEAPPILPPGEGTWKTPGIVAVN